MAVTVTMENTGKYLVIDASEKLRREDYERLVPEVEHMMKDRGNVRMLFHMHNFHGWSAGAFWADAKFGVHHYRDIERIAVVGEKRWQRAMTTICRPFTQAKIRYFAGDQEELARQWLEEESAKA
jgi:hypothetical protein